MVAESVYRLDEEESIAKRRALRRGEHCVEKSVMKRRVA